MLEAAAAAPAAEETPLRARVANLDHDQVYWGLGEPVPVAELKSGDRVFGDEALKTAIALAKLTNVIWVATSCDLAGGLYKLVPPDDESKVWSFEPLPTQLQKTVPGVPTLEQAVYDFLAAFQAGGAQLPPRAQAWAKWFENTMDGRIA